MPEPVSVGALVAAALGAGAAALAKGVLSAAAKDAYEKLKSAVARWASDDVARLEQKQSPVREAALAEIVDEREKNEKQDLAALAQALLALFDEKERARVENRITVIATHGGMAAGRDQTINYGPPPASKGEKDG